MTANEARNLTARELINGLMNDSQYRRIYRDELQRRSREGKIEYFDCLLYSAITEEALHWKIEKVELGTYKTKKVFENFDEQIKQMLDDSYQAPPPFPKKPVTAAAPPPTPSKPRQRIELNYENFPWMDEVPVPEWMQLTQKWEIAEEAIKNGYDGEGLRNPADMAWVHAAAADHSTWADLHPQGARFWMAFRSNYIRFLYNKNKTVA
jgi:hypothetical protein